jgi:hypothetical protein
MEFLMSRSYRKNPCSSHGRRSCKSGKTTANRLLRRAVNRMIEKCKGENQYIYFDYVHPKPNEVFDYGWSVEPGSYFDPKSFEKIKPENYRYFYGK